MLEYEGQASLDNQSDPRDHLYPDGQCDLPAYLALLANRVESYRVAKIPKFFCKDPVCSFFQVEVLFDKA